MQYLVAVLSDRIQAEAAYTALEKEGLTTNDRVTILGRGYQTADEFGLIDPNEAGRKQAKFMAYWLIPFGFAGGYVFNVLTGLQPFPGGEFGNHIIGGVLGAIAGAMGSVFVGGGVGVAFGSGDALPYRNRLNQGKYLIIVEGSNITINKATRVLRQFSPENLQGYSEPLRQN